MKFLKTFVILIIADFMLCVQAAPQGTGNGNGTSALTGLAVVMAATALGCNKDRLTMNILQNEEARHTSERASRQRVLCLLAHGSMNSWNGENVRHSGLTVGTINASGEYLYSHQAIEIAKGLEMKGEVLSSLPDMSFTSQRNERVSVPAAFMTWNSDSSPNNIFTVTPDDKFHRAVRNKAQKDIHAETEFGRGLGLYGYDPSEKKKKGNRYSFTYLKKDTKDLCRAWRSRTGCNDVHKLDRLQLFTYAIENGYNYVLVMACKGSQIRVEDPSDYLPIFNRKRRQTPESNDSNDEPIVRQQSKRCEPEKPEKPEKRRRTDNNDSDDEPIVRQQSKRCEPEKPEKPEKRKRTDNNDSDDEPIVRQQSKRCEPEKPEKPEKRKRTDNNVNSKNKSIVPKKSEIILVTNHHFHLKHGAKFLKKRYLCYESAQWSLSEKPFKLQLDDQGRLIKNKKVKFTQKEDFFYVEEEWDRRTKKGDISHNNTVSVNPESGRIGWREAGHFKPYECFKLES